jgi:microcin C transport system substrate-binding protein
MIGRMVEALLGLGLGIGFALAGGPAHAGTRTVHGMSLLGDVKYQPGFTHLDYVNVDAPKGGEIRLAATGSFDSLNPFILKGRPAAALGLVFETLMTSTLDEPDGMYGLLAESAEVPDDLSWVSYTLRAGARWHDGTPVTVDDVIFSFDILKAKGHPTYRTYYKDVVRAEAAGPRTVRFVFAGAVNRELPQIVGQLPVLPKAYFATRDFEETALEPILGSGPYRVAAVEPGRSITYERVADYWGRDLAINRGQNNFDRLRYDYYRDETVELEAFKAREFDFRQESSAKVWATGYDSPALRDELVIKEEIPHEMPTPTQAFVFNLRRDIFTDRRVRQALALAFDFEWANKNLFYEQYTRTRSFYPNTELEAKGVPGPAELIYLEPFRGRIPEEVFTTEFNPPGTDGSGNNRANLRQAQALLRDAGWRVRDNRLVRDADGRPLEFEILLVSPAFERVALPYRQNLEKLGVRVDVRLVDTAQYQNRIDTFDFDMTVHAVPPTLSPGNEQREFWSSASADLPGSRNVIGVRDPVVDALVEKIVAAPDRAALVAATRALDRVLQWGFYVVPHWHSRTFRVAYWNRFGHPAVTPRHGLGLLTWWVDPAKDAALDRRMGIKSP